MDFASSAVRQDESKTAAQELRILIVEDQPSDAELLQRELRRGGFNFSSKCVCTREAFQQQLDAFVPDLIISDFSMPAFDGLSALDLTLEHAPEVPFIFVSGTIGEDRAIDALTRGAADYILKDRPKRLIPAVNRALDGAEKRKVLRASQHALTASEKRFRTFMQHMPASAALLDGDGVYTFVNENWERAAGKKADEIVGRRCDEVLRHVANDDIRSLLDQVIQSKECISRVVRTGSEECERWWVSNYFPIPDEDGTVPLVGTVAIDITEQRSQQEKLSYLASHDILTGLPNRSFFHERLSRHLLDADSSGSRTALILWNINRFSTIRDSLGHSAGEALLVEIAKRLRSYWPQTDNVAHIAADCFAAVLTDALDEAHASQTIEEVSKQVCALPFLIEGNELAVSMTAGVALSPSDGDDVEALFRNAQSALNQARSSSAPLLFYRPAMNEAVSANLVLENKLRRAIDKQQFVLHYQPKLSLATGKIVGLEALIRWNDPVSGLVPPVKFIPVLEETGMIKEAGEWALRRALADYRAWHRAGLKPPRIAVNVSAIQLAQKSFTDLVREIVRDFDAGSHGLDLEITESLLMIDIEASILKLHEIQETGFNIAIDDFGTGYSSLGYLARLPINALKIDRSFVQTMAKQAQGMAIASTIISLAHSLDLKVIAEGVETEDQRRLLRLLRCEEAQGYLFHKPLPLEQITELLKSGA